MGAPLSYYYLVGVDLDGATPAQTADFLRFYDEVHCPEVVCFNPGFLEVRRYELLTPTGAHPRFLNVYALGDLAAAERYANSQAAPAESRPRYTPRPAEWSALRRISLRSLWVGARPPAAPDPWSADVIQLTWASTPPHVRRTKAQETRVLRLLNLLEPVPADAPSFCIVAPGLGRNADDPNPQDSGGRSGPRYRLLSGKSGAERGSTPALTVARDVPAQK